MGEFHMSPAIVFQIHLVLGYVPWLLAFSAYLWPRLKTKADLTSR